MLIIQSAIAEDVQKEGVNYDWKCPNCGFREPVMASINRKDLKQRGTEFFEGRKVLACASNFQNFADFFQDVISINSRARKQLLNRFREYEDYFEIDLLFDIQYYFWKDKDATRKPGIRWCSLSKNDLAHILVINAKNTSILKNLFDKLVTYYEQVISIYSQSFEENVEIFQIHLEKLRERLREIGWPNKFLT